MDIEWAGHTVAVDGTTDGAAALPDVARFDALARQAMRDNAAELFRDYLDFDGAEDMLRAVFGTGDVDPQTFLTPMRLIRIGLRPDEPDTGAVFDYTLGRDLTDQLVAVKFDNDGAVIAVAVES